MNTYEEGEERNSRGAEGGKVAAADIKVCGFLGGWNGRGISMALSGGSSKDPDFFLRNNILILIGSRGKQYVHAKSTVGVEGVWKCGRRLRRQRACGRQFRWFRCRISCLVESSR
jgi:hypothetical protein